MAQKPDEGAPPAKVENIIRDPGYAIPLIYAQQVEEEPIEWLVPGFLARAELTDLSGDPGVGKGGIVASWTARVTNETEHKALLFSTEDRLGHLKARLRAEGADLWRVLLLDIRQANASPILPGDIGEVEDIVRHEDVAFVAFDPALEFMAAQLDSHKQQDVQLFCASLAGLAHRTRASVLTVRHLNKARGTSAIYKAAGSIGFIARARMALLASKDQQSGKRALAVAKGNIGKDTTAQEFDIVEKDGSTIIAWGGSVNVTADELVNQDPAKQSARGPSAAKLEAAKDFLMDVLRNGPVQVQEVVKQARTERIHKTTLYEAKSALGVRSVTLNLARAWKLNSGKPDSEVP